MAPSGRAGKGAKAPCPPQRCGEPHRGWRARHSASCRTFTPVFDGLWTRVTALTALPALRGCFCSLDLGAREVDDLLPLGGLFGDDLPELVRRCADRNGAELGEALLDRRLGEDRVNFLVRLLGDFPRG